jgi:hypothetical protein
MKTTKPQVTGVSPLRPGLTESNVLSRLNGVFTFQMVLTGRRFGWGLEWGSIAAARQRFVWHERMGGGTVIWDMHPADTVPRLRSVPVKIIQ